jgi:hypothetical protein
MKMFHKKPDEKIIQDNTDKYEQEISEKLNPPMQVRSGKYNMTHQHKTSRETD